jgi:NADH-quinone oxidoreductase subunit M
VVFGEIANDNVAKLEDINRREFLVLGILALVVLLLGVWPAPLLEVMNATVDHLIQHIAVSKL